MPALNMGLRQKVADMITAGFDDKDIRKECPTAQYMIASLRRIVELGLPLNTCIRRDGSIGAGPRHPVLTEEERRSRQLEYHREWDRKHRVRKKPAFEFTKESDGTLNIITTEPHPIEAKKERERLAVRKCRAKKLSCTESDATARVEKRMILSCCTRQEQTPEETTTARKNFLSTSLKLLASDIVSMFPAVDMSEFDEILRKVSQ